MKRSYLIFPIVFTIILFLIFTNTLVFKSEKPSTAIKNTKTFSANAAVCYVDTGLNSCKSTSCPTIEECINNNKGSNSLDIKILVDEYTQCPNIEIKSDMAIKFSSNDANRVTELKCESGFIINAGSNDVKIYLENLNFNGQKSTCLSLTSQHKNYLSIENCQFYGCESLGDGGAILALGFDVNVGGSSFSENTAKNSTLNPGSGGAIWSNHLITISKSNFDSNKADQFGGAIYGGSVKIEDTEFTNCEAHSGGAISTSKATIQSSIFSQNTAVENGGAIELNTANSNSYFLNNEFTSNTAYYGGHIFLLPTNISIMESTFNGGVAEYGGALYVQDKYYDKIDYIYEFIDSKFISNKAHSKGGAFFSLHRKNIFGGVFRDSVSSDTVIQSFPDFYLDHVYSSPVSSEKNCSMRPAVKDSSFEQFLCVGLDSKECSDKKSFNCKVPTVKY